jgi:multiple sugar transport system substrate-binding protein
MGRRPRYRRGAAGMAVFVPMLAAALVVACGGGGADRPIELRFWAMGREGEVVQELVRDFEALNPGIRVRVQQIPWSAAHEKLLTAVVGRATPDVAQLGNTWIPEFAMLRSLAPLDGWLGRSEQVDEAAFFPGIWATNRIDGAVYGIPWYVDTRVLFYRTDLLATAGHERPPETWAEWRAAMVALRRAMAPDQYPILLPTNEWSQPVILGLQAGAPLLGPGGRRGAFRDPRFREAFEFYVGLFRDGLAPTLANTEVSNLYQEFARGNIGMYITGPWNIGEFTRRLPPEVQDRWATAPLPGPTGPGVSTAGGSSLVVFRGSSHGEAAWRLVEYLSQPAQQVRFHELTGNLPAVKSAWASPVLTGNRHAAAFRDQLERVEPLPPVPEIESIVTKVFEHAESTIRGRVSVDAALAALDRDVDRILEKRRWILDREQDGG